MKLKREAYLGKDWCLASLGTMKKGWYSPKSQFYAISIVKKWRRREWIRMMKWVFRVLLLPSPATWTGLEESSAFYPASPFVSDSESVSFFLSKLDSGTSRISSLAENPIDLEMRKTHNRCILHRLPTILWNQSDFDKSQHSTTCLGNLLEKL